MNHLQNKLNAVHSGEFLPFNYTADEFIELSIKSSKPLTLTFVDYKFNQLIDLILESYKNTIKLLEINNDFFQPQLIIKLDTGTIIIKISMREKQEKQQ